MGKALCIFLLIAAILTCCSKTENVKTGSNSLVGGWKSDSSVYQGYSNNKLVQKETDRNDGSEEETIYFSEQGTFRYYYVSLEKPGKRDTLETTAGTYTFDAATKELVVANATKRETNTVIYLDDKKLIYEVVINNPDEPGQPDINKEVVSFYLSKLK